MFSFGFHPESVLSSGCDGTNKSCHSQLKKTYPTCSSPKAIPAPLPKDCTALQVWLPHSAPATAAQQELGPHSRQNPRATLSPGKEFERYWIHKPREAQELPELCPNHNEPREHRRGSGNAPSALASSQRQDRLLTKSPWDTILVPDFRWQLHSKSMDLLENCILYLSRWVWLGFFWFCLVWVGAFYNLYRDCFDGSLQFQTGCACATFKSLVMIDIANSASPGQCWQTAGLSQHFWQ